MISVVIPTHNRIDDLKKALQSAYVQTVLPNEIIVVDDGSSPAVTEEIFAEAPKQIKTLLLHNEQAKGAPNARNRGIEAASSEWIAFLDDDDEFAVNKIEKVEQCIKENSDADVIYHRAVINMVNEHVAYLTPDLSPVPDSETFPRLLVKNFVGSTPVVICRRDALIKVGKFDEKLKLRQDYELWLRCAKFGCKFVSLNYPLTNFNSVTTKSSVSKGVELYKSTMAYIQEKYSNDFASLSKKEKRNFEERMNDEMVHKYLLNGKMKEARSLQFKQIVDYPSIKNIVSFAALLFGFRFTLRLKAMTRNPKNEHKRSCQSMKSNYSHSEKLFAVLLGHFPLFKKLIKAVYTRMMYLMYKKSEKLICKLSLISVLKEEAETFFGYYDTSPTSSHGQCLVNVTKNKTFRLPDADSPISIKVLDGNNVMDIALTSSAYNWQQGARAQWLTEDVFLFNDFDKEKQKYIAKAYSLGKRAIVKIFDHPVQDSFHDEYFLSLNYRRIGALQPEYGYRRIPALSKMELSEIKNDGIWYVDVNNGESKLLYSIEAICQVNYNPMFSKAMHEINHVMISPDGSTCIFIHRYYLGKRRFDRLFLASTKESRLNVLAENGMVSHCFWIDNKTVLGYMRGPDKKDAYWLIDIDSGKFDRLPNNALDRYGDGHPHVLHACNVPHVYGDGNWFVTDTYPDKARMQHLLLCNWKTGEVKELGQFFHGFKYSGETRCDLHPRFSSDGKSVFFDSVFNGKRCLYKMDLNV